MSDMEMGAWGQSKEFGICLITLESQVVDMGSGGDIDVFLMGGSRRKSAGLGHFQCCVILPLLHGIKHFSRDLAVPTLEQKQDHVCFNTLAKAPGARVFLSKGQTQIAEHVGIIQHGVLYCVNSVNQRWNFPEYIFSMTADQNWPQEKFVRDLEGISKAAETVL